MPVRFTDLIVDRLISLARKKETDRNFDSRFSSNNNDSGIGMHTPRIVIKLYQFSSQIFISNFNANSILYSKFELVRLLMLFKSKRIFN